MTSDFACDMGHATGTVVAKHGASDADAASVLLVLAVSLGTMGQLSQAELREMFEGALQMGPAVAAAAMMAKGGTS
jgi:hypothetical protein